MNPLRIVVADDNVDSAESLALMLSIQGHQVRTARDGREAVQLAEHFHPDVMVLDIGMPNGDGYEAARRMRERDPRREIVLVALTGWGQEDRVRTLEAGFDHHYVKPIDPAELERLLASLGATTT